MTARVILCVALACVVAWVISAAVSLDSWGYWCAGMLAGAIGSAIGIIWDERRAA